MTKNGWQVVSHFRTFRGHMENHAKNGPKSRFKKWDAKPFLRIIHDIFSIFRLHFPKKQEWTVCRQDLASIQNGPAARCKLLLCPSTLPNWRNAVGLKSYAGKALFKGSSKRTYTQTCLPSRTSRFLPRKFRNAQN